MDVYVFYGFHKVKKVRVDFATEESTAMPVALQVCICHSGTLS